MFPKNKAVYYTKLNKSNKKRERKKNLPENYFCTKIKILFYRCLFEKVLKNSFYDLLKYISI